MTINKAQCQTLDKVGIYLPEHVFSYGQLSRATSLHNVKIQVKTGNCQITNEVWGEVLDA